MLYVFVELVGVCDEDGDCDDFYDDDDDDYYI